jgi:hypothetical protein
MAAEGRTVPKRVVLTSILLGLGLGVIVVAISIIVLANRKQWLAVHPVMGTPVRDILSTSIREGQQPTNQHGSDMSSLSILVSGPVDGIRVLVVDPLERTTGVMPGDWDSAHNIHGKIIEDIPRSVDFIDSLADEVTGASPTDQGQTIIIGQPTNGEYTVEISGGANTPYNLSISGIATDNSQLNKISLVGKTQVGVVSRYYIAYTAVPGSRIDVRRQATK